MTSTRTTSSIKTTVPTHTDACVALTIDFDADVGRAWQRLDDRLTSTSERRFGAVRGVHRLLELLADQGIPATFYVPGEIAERYPEAVRAIADAGHEIGHHGHVHLWSDRVDEQAQRDELERGTAALGELLGAAPAGYRSPGWELTPFTFGLLVDAGFSWDSSCMADDRPYLEEHNGRSILELPVHWSLDDWVYFGFQRDSLGHMADPTAMTRAWLDEFDSACRDRRVVTYTLHPECSGRGYRMVALERMLVEMRRRANVWFASHRQVAEAAQPTR